MLKLEMIKRLKIPLIQGLIVLVKQVSYLVILVVAGGISSNPEKAAVDAAKAVGASTGADILKAIIKDKGDSAKLANNTPTTTVTSITKSHDATIAGAIVLRAMAPGGKFANGTSGNDISTAVKGVAVSAVTKALDTLTIAIRKTINTGLKTVKDAITKS
nr:variable large family protein [Borrelia coriaceae]